MTEMHEIKSYGKHKRGVRTRGNIRGLLEYGHVDITDDEFGYSDIWGKTLVLKHTWRKHEDAESKLYIMLPLLIAGVAIKEWRGDLVVVEYEHDDDESFRFLHCVPKGQFDFINSTYDTNWMDEYKNALQSRDDCEKEICRLKEKIRRI